MAKSLYGFACLTVAFAGFPGLSAIAQQEMSYSHPAETTSATASDSQSLNDLHVPLLNREAPEPSYGPAASGESLPTQADMPAAMDHSAHQMSDMTEDGDQEGAQ